MQLKIVEVYVRVLIAAAVVAVGVALVSHALYPAPKPRTITCPADETGAQRYRVEGKTIICDKEKDDK